MSRILMIVTVLLMGVSAWFIYSQGFLNAFINPTVLTLEASRAIESGQRVRTTMVAVVETPVKELPPSAISFSKTASEQDVQAFLSEGRTIVALEEGQILTGLNFGKSRSVWHLQSKQSLQAGQAIEAGVIEPFEAEIPDAQALSFSSNAEASNFLSSRPDLSAQRNITSGSSIALEDIASIDGGTVFVLETLRAVSRNESMTPADVTATSRPSDELPRASIAFSSRSAADIFVTSTNTLTASDDIPMGTILTSSLLRPGVGRSTARNLSLEELGEPETLEELLVLQENMPFEIKTINLVNNRPDSLITQSVVMVGGKPREGSKMALWVETDSTVGPLGSVRLRKFVSDITIRKTVDAEIALESRRRVQIEAEAETSGATVIEPGASETNESRGIFYWADVSRAGGLAIEEAKEDGRIAFMLSEDTPVADFLGNGVVCREDYCTINRATSDDLKAIRDTLQEFNELSVAQSDQGNQAAPFSILEGVSVELEQAMHAAGYTTFEQVAAWRNEDISRLEFELNISNNLAMYIREQSRQIAEVPVSARQELGIAQTPNQ